MSESDDEGISDIEVDDDLDDFDPLVDQEGGNEENNASGSDDGDDEGVEAFEEDIDAVSEIEAPHHGKKALSAGVKQRSSERRRNPRDRQVAQAVDTRRIVVVSDEERVTSNVMTKAEITRAIALRTQQISRYPSTYTNTDGLTHAKEIATLELYNRKSPLILRRFVGWTSAGEKIIEKWKVREMTYRPLN